jgi:5'-nucleotidase
MNNPRRLFLNQLTLMAGVATLNKPLTSVAAIAKHINTLQTAKSAVTVYHTNDLRGNIDAVYKNMGGLNQIKAVLKNQELNGMLVDAGSFLNASGNLWQQKQVIHAMNGVGYHVATIGNHELSCGQGHLAALVPLMRFTLVNCNYQFDNQLSKLVKPYVIINSGKFRIGITGVGQQLKGTTYNDAIESANRVARLLKEDEKCDFVICLSHLGYVQEGNRPDNQKLAKQSENIDMIVGGHNNNLFNNTLVLSNKLKHEIIVAQTAWDGLMMGRTIINFDKEKKKNGIRAKHFIPGMPGNLSYEALFSNLQLAKDLPLST